METNVTMTAWEERELDGLGYSKEEIEIGKKCYQDNYSYNPYSPKFLEYMESDFGNWEIFVFKCKKLLGKLAMKNK